MSCFENNPITRKRYIGNSKSLSDDDINPYIQFLCKKLDLFELENLLENVFNIFDQCILLHSEKNSNEIDKYANSGFIPTYYWSHALIARDWFRYAQHINNQSNTQQITELMLKMIEQNQDLTHKIVELTKNSVSVTNYTNVNSNNKIQIFYVIGKY